MAGFFKKVFSFSKKTEEENLEQSPALTPFEAHQLALQQAKEQQETIKHYNKKAKNAEQSTLKTQHNKPKSHQTTQKPDNQSIAPKSTAFDEIQTVIDNNDLITVDVDNSLLIEEKLHFTPDTKPVADKNIDLKTPKNPKSTGDVTARAHHDGLEQKKQPITGRVHIGDNIEQVQEVETIPVEEPSTIKRSWLERLRHGLSRSSRQLGDSINNIFTKRKLDEDTLQDLEDVLIASDLGIETAMRITDSLSAGRYGKDISTDEVRTIMREEIEKVLTPVAKPLELDLGHKPHVILVVGVNGTGKTTTIGKLAAKLSRGGLKVMLAAGDTFRAAAIEQLHIWGKRTHSPVISTKLGADAASLAFEAYEKAKEAGSDVLIIDTAGRLQNKTELMDELAKIVRVLGKHNADAPHTVLQTLDATTGQNALSQVEIFRNVAGVNGLVMTKLDGTARGGILVAIAAKHQLPVYFIGVGEDIDDLEPFKAGEFAQAIAGIQNEKPS